MNFVNFTLIDLVCLLICGILSLNGYRRGAINSLIRFGGFIASFVIARFFSPILAAKLIQVPLFREMVDKISVNPLIIQARAGLEEIIALVIAQFVSFGLLIILVSIVIGLLQSIFRGVHRIPVIGKVDRIVGLGVGLIVGLGFCFLMVWIFKMIDLYNNESLNWFNYQNSFFYQRVFEIFLSKFG